MATGQSVFDCYPAGNEPPATNYATRDDRNGHPVLDFDTTTQETAQWTLVMPLHYAGGGVTVSIVWMASTATTGNGGWDVAFERMDAALDQDADSFATAQVVTAVTVPGTSGQSIYSTLAVTNGANMDSVVAGDVFRLRIRRNVATDTAAGDLELLTVFAKET